MERRGRSGRKLTWQECVRVPFPLVTVPPVESDRWSCLSLYFIPLTWYVAFEDLEPADLNNRISATRIVRTACQKPVLDTLYNDAAYVGCSVVSSRCMWS
jgi:hypothetical protein